MTSPSIAWLAEGRDDPERYLVYADALAASADPYDRLHAELIVTQHRDDPALRDHERSLQEQLAPLKLYPDDGLRWR